MNSIDLQKYLTVRENGNGYYEQKRGLIAVWGKEAGRFLNGLVTNDVEKLEDGAQLRAAFPNAQGRLLAAVRVIRTGDRFLFETEETTHEKVFNNLFRFTFAGDFFVEDLSEKYLYFEVQSAEFKVQSSDLIKFESKVGADYFVPVEAAEGFIRELREQHAVEVSDQTYEVLRVENGIPRYGFDMDETTIVPELGIDGQISYNKGCYIGQEIIARIYFRGHVAKQLRGVILDNENAKAEPGDELKSLEGKNAGRITSVAFSPKLQKTIALAFVRYDYLAEATELKVNEEAVKVKELPFIS